RTRMRVASRSSSCVRTSATSVSSVMFSRARPCARPGARRDEHRKWIACLARADTDFDAGQSGRGEHLLQLVVLESEAPVAELGADPLFLMRTQVEQQDTAAGRGDARRFGDGA